MHFIDEATLKRLAPIAATLDGKFFGYLITTCEQLYVFPPLGSAYATDLLSRMETDTLEEKEAVLVGLLQPALAQFIVYEALPTLNMQITQKGVMQKSDAYAAQASVEDLKFLRGTVRELAEKLRDVALKYLQDNAADLPGYVLPDDGTPDRNEEKTYGLYVPVRGSGRGSTNRWNY